MGKPDRPFSSGRNKDHAVVEKLCGTSVEIVCEGLSKKAALEIEAELIAEFSKKFHLVNRAGSEQRTKVFIQKLTFPRKVRTTITYNNLTKTKKRKGAIKTPFSHSSSHINKLPH